MELLFKLSHLRTETSWQYMLHSLKELLVLTLHTQNTDLRAIVSFKQDAKISIFTQNVDILWKIKVTKLPYLTSMEKISASSFPKKDVLSNVLLPL